MLTLNICRQELPEHTNPVHFQRLKSIETLLKNLLTPPATTPALARSRHESAGERDTVSPFRTWGEFKSYVESEATRDDHRIAWINVDTSNPNTVVVYDLREGEKVIEHAEDVIETDTVY